MAHELPIHLAHRLPDGGQLVFWKEDRSVRNGRVLEVMDDGFVLVQYAQGRGVMLPINELSEVDPFFTRSIEKR